MKGQGGVAAVKSQETGRTYLTVRKARIACTFDEQTCESLIGSELDGKVIKVPVEPYEYALPDTGEVMTLEHRYEYIDNVKDTIRENVMETVEVA